MKTFVCFFSPQLILQKSNDLFQRKLSFFNVLEGGPTFSSGVQLFPGGSNFFQGGGSNCLFPIETHITCDFPAGSGPPVPPLDPHLVGLLFNVQNNTNNTKFIYIVGHTNVGSLRKTPPGMDGMTYFQQSPPSHVRVIYLSRLILLVTVPG